MNCIEKCQVSADWHSMCGFLTIYLVPSHLASLPTAFTNVRVYGLAVVKHQTIDQRTRGCTYSLTASFMFGVKCTDTSTIDLSIDSISHVL